jgi:hypothetical protein
MLTAFGRVVYLVERPCHARQATDGLGGQVRESAGGEVKVPSVAADATVDNCNGDSLAIVWTLKLGLNTKSNGSVRLHLALSFLPQIGLSLGLAPL